MSVFKRSLVPPSDDVYLSVEAESVSALVRATTAAEDVGSFLIHVRQALFAMSRGSSDSHPDLGPVESASSMQLSVEAIDASVLGSVGHDEVRLPHSPDSSRGEAALLATSCVKGLSVSQNQSPSERSMSVTAGDVSVQAVTSAVEVIDRLIDRANSLRRTRPPGVSGKNEASMARDLVSGLLVRARQAGITVLSPQCLTRSDWIHQAEDSTNVRNTPGWIIVHHLRHWLRELGSPPSPGQSIKEEDESRLNEELAFSAGLQPNSRGSFSGLSFLSRTVIADDQADALKPAHQMSIGIDHVDARHYDYLLENRSLSVSHVSLLSSSITTISTLEPTSQGQRQQYKAILGIGRLDGDLQNSLFRLAPALLGLNAATTKLMPTQTSQDAEHDLVFHIGIAAALVKARAGQIQTSLRAEDAKSTMHFRSEPTNAESPETLATKVVSIFAKCLEFAMIPPRDRPKPTSANRRDSVFNLRLDHLAAFTSQSGPLLKEPDGQLQIVLGVGGISVETKSKIEAFTGLVKEWVHTDLGYIRFPFSLGSSI